MQRGQGDGPYFSAPKLSSEQMREIYLSNCFKKSFVLTIYISGSEAEYSCSLLLFLLEE